MAQTLGQAGNELTAVGERAAYLERQAEYRQDVISAEDAFNKLQQQRLSLEFDPKDGFRNAQGEAAIGKEFRQRYADAFKNSSAQIESGLANDNQKALFRRRANVAGMQYQSALLSHIAQQTNVYADNTTKATVQVAKQSAAANWGDDTAFASDIVRVENVLAADAARRQLPPAQAEAARQAAVADMWADRIKAANNSDPVAANEMFSAHANELTPNDRVAVEHLIKVSLLPVQARIVADYVMAGPGSRAQGELQRVLGAEGEGALQKVANEIGPMPTDVRSTRANLGNWIAAGEKVADRLHINNPVFRDAVVQQIRGRVATIVAMQEGVQREAQGTLLTMVGGGPEGKGAKPLTLDQLLSMPGARAAWGVLDPAAAAGIRAHLEHNANEAERGTPVRSNATVVNDAFTRIFLPDDHPRKISRPEQLVPLFAHGVNRSDFNWLATLVRDNITPDGQKLGDTRKQFLGAVKGQFTKSTMLNVDAKGDEDFYRFSSYVTQQEAEARRTGKDPYSLYDPNSPEYLGKKVPAFQRPLQEQIRDMAAGLRTQTQGGAVLPPVTATGPNGERLILKDGKWQKP